MIHTKSFYTSRLDLVIPFGSGEKLRNFSVYGKLISLGVESVLVQREMYVALRKFGYIDNKIQANSYRGQ